MKTSFLKTIYGRVLASTLALTVAGVLVFAQKAQEAKPAQEESPEHSKLVGRIEGVWDVRVTIRRCDTGDPIRTVRAMNMYNRGGTLTETGGSSSVLRGPSFGTWHHVGGQTYAAVFRFFGFNAQGAAAGTLTKITRNIELSQDGNKFSATASFETLDTNDILIGTGCATETASRLD